MEQAAHLEQLPRSGNDQVPLWVKVAAVGPLSEYRCVYGSDVGEPIEGRSFDLERWEQRAPPACSRVA
jgi:hypothetical protein